jgi:hypothetical protein
MLSRVLRAEYAAQAREVIESQAASLTRPAACQAAESKRPSWQLGRRVSQGWLTSYLHHRAEAPDDLLQAASDLA